jgi:hypothetical protein
MHATPTAPSSTLRGHVVRAHIQSDVLGGDTFHKAHNTLQLAHTVPCAIPAAAYSPIATHALHAQLPTTACSPPPSQCSLLVAQQHPSNLHSPSPAPLQRFLPLLIWLWLWHRRCSSLQAGNICRGSSARLPRLATTAVSFSSSSALPDSFIIAAADLGLALFLALALAPALLLPSM